MNLETGRCDPTIDLLALETCIPGSEESARRIVRRSLARADKLGWIERTGRHAGSRWNRSNSYRLRIPKDIHPDKFDWSSGQIEVVDRTPESGRIGKENREGYIKRGEFEKGGSGRPLGPREATVFVAAALQKNLNTTGSILEYAQKLGYSLPDNQLAAAMAACAMPADVGARTEGVEP